MTEAIQEIIDEGAAVNANAQAPAEAAPVDVSPQADAAADVTPPDTDAPPQDGPTWPEDWREKLAGDDEAFLKQLKRYSSPTTFAKGFKERESLIRSGQLKQAKPDGTDEKAMAEWRKDNGVPDDPTGYKVPDDVAKFLTDGDKPIVSAWFEDAHAAGFNQEQAQRGLEWYAKTLSNIEEQQAAADNQAKNAAEDALRKEWSHAEYKANTTLAARYLANTPLGEQWADLRTADGRRLGDSPDFVMWAADQGRQSFGDVAFATGESDRKFAARKDEIESVLKTDINRYFKEGLDKEYAEILKTDEKRKR
ncbi:hypothetical protein GOZ96_04750 [Agrobacterium vitis]|uniref:Uncharacterized protein n=1 Tax=Agrobacterium vitis TaxID=373 RepID=A0A7J4X585_AGRVI|nr:hypothetical protein [Agrobacterium vitis]KAA3527053.1 hypothetical protein DXT89_14050 [Agrobacterium vitis]MUZ95898.1 hypothetical protein [Agrobacterium vitis]